jgi:pyruvate,water dikinase
MERADLVPVLLQPPAESMTLQTNRALWQLGQGAIPLERFLEDFGHRASNSWELFSPRWHELPEEATRLARTVASGPDPSIHAQERVRAAEKALATLPLAVRSLLVLTRRYLLLRENQRFHYDRLLWAWKSAYLWLEDDTGLALRFLEAAEIRALLAEELSTEAAAQQIARRRSAWMEENARWQRGDEPPTFLVGDDAYDDSTGGDRLQGMGISPGVVTGPVRVLRTLSDAERLRPGEILVTQATDPSWTPLFLTAAGLVMERGGMLSHGAVVAREYQLPAVVNVSAATRLLSDGQIITVDGSRGVVWVR